MYKEDFIKEWTDRTNAHDQYTRQITECESTIKQLERQNAVLMKETNSTEDVKRSRQSKEDIWKSKDEERAGIDTQLREYKSWANAKVSFVSCDQNCL